MYFSFFKIFFPFVCFYPAMDLPSTSAPSTPILEDSGTSIVYIIQGFVIFFFALLIVAASVLNLLVIQRLPDISEASKVFYNSLSVADLIFGIVLLPSLPSSVVGDWPLGDVVCKLFGFGMGLSTIFSAGSLLLLNLDRFFTVVSPFHYPVFMNQRKATVVVLALCVVEAMALIVAIVVNPLGAGIIQYSKLGGCLVIFSEPNFRAYSIAIFAIFVWSFLPILSVMYARIICISRRHVRKIQVQEVVKATPRKNDSQPEEGAGQPENGGNGHRALRMTLLITGAYIVTWIPFTVSETYVAMGRELSTLIRILVTWPIMLNPLSNVAIYSATKELYRNEARILLLKCITCWRTCPRKDPSHGVIHWFDWLIELLTDWLIAWLVVLLNDRWLIDWSIECIFAY